MIIGKDNIFMQDIYTYIPETNHALKEYNVATVLSLLVGSSLPSSGGFLGPSESLEIQIEWVVYI
jgi:hypothetical protein